MLSFLQFLWTTRVRMPRTTVVQMTFVILFLRLVMRLHEETVPLVVGRVVMLRIFLVSLVLGRLGLRMSASTFPDYSDCGEDGDDSVRNIARLLEEFDTLKFSLEGGASASSSSSCRLSYPQHVAAFAAFSHSTGWLNFDFPCLLHLRCARNPAKTWLDVSYISGQGRRGTSGGNSALRSAGFGGGLAGKD